MIIPVKHTTGEYNIILKHGGLNELKSHLQLDRKVLIVTDSGVPAEYAKTVAEQCSTQFIVTVSEGEASKCFENFKFLLSKMVKFGFTRSDCVVAVGGGVVGDIGQWHIGIQKLQSFALLSSGLQPLRIKKLFTYKRDTAVEGIVHLFTIRGIGDKMLSIRC